MARSSMKDKLKRIWKEVALAQTGYYVDICRETTDNRNEDNGCPSRESNREFTEYESRALSLSQTRSLKGVAEHEECYVERND
jgi:hypothetical protein